MNRTHGSPPPAQEPKRGRAGAAEPSNLSVAGIVPTPLAFSGAAWVEGPLLAVRGVEGGGCDEFARVRLPSGEVRTGLVLEVHHDVAIVEVLQGTGGIDPGRVSVAFEGRPFDIPVGQGWLGRGWNGMGEALDGGPPMLSR